MKILLTGCATRLSSPKSGFIGSRDRVREVFYATPSTGFWATATQSSAWIILTLSKEERAAKNKENWTDPIFLSSPVLRSLGEGGSAIPHPPSSATGAYPGADRIMNEAIFVGTYPGLTKLQLDHMVRTIRDFVAKYG